MFLAFMNFSRENRVSTSPDEFKRLSELKLDDRSEHTLDESEKALSSVGTFLLLKAQRKSVHEATATLR